MEFIVPNYSGYDVMRSGTFLESMSAYVGGILKDEKAQKTTQY